jgi:undecaprenyl-diphosphatase
MLGQLLELDRKLSQKFLLPEDSTLLRQMAAFFAHSGDSWFWLAGLFVIWLVAKGNTRSLAALFAGAILIQAALVLAIKFLIRRRRPEGDWGELYRKADPHSFPSGHAVRAVMLALMAWQLGVAPLNLILAIWAPLVSFARVALGLHFLVDILAGWLLGIALALSIVQAWPLFIAIFPWVF